MAKKARGTRILILGGGYVGMYTALGLRSVVRSGEATVTVVDPQPHMPYKPFLPEAAAGSIEPRHVVVPLRRTLRHCHVMTARVTGISHERRVVITETSDGHVQEVGYDILVVALGSIARLLPVPGLAEQAISFQTIGEAIYLRNHVLSRLDKASATLDPQLRRRLLTFLVIGGGYAGIEALAELEDMARYSLRYYENIEPADLRWVLVEAAGRIMPEVRDSLGVYTVQRLEERGIEVYLDTRVKTMEGGHVELDDGTKFDTDTIVWTAGVKANPVLAESDLPLDDRGRVLASAAMRVQGAPEVWAAGDCAAVPDNSRRPAEPDALCAPNAQHAVRQANRLASNIVAVLRGREPVDYYHRNVGSVASLGLHKGVADTYNVKVKGVLAWAMHRGYHLSRMPTFNRKARVLLDWMLTGLFRREIVSMGQINDPKAEFTRATKS